MESGLFFNSSCHGNMLFLGNGDNVFRGARSGMNMGETSKRRPFFTSPDDMFEEEYYEDQLQEKKRRLSPEQVHMLEKTFEEENKLEPERKTQLAKKLGLQPRQVAVWFQNRRARWKTKQLERDFDRLKSSYDSLVSDCDSILMESARLKAEVVSLTEKLQSKEVAGVPVLGEKYDSPPVEDDRVPAIQLNVRVEDRLSMGSVGSAAVDDQDGPQFVDSGDSYFPNPECVAPVDQSEDDDGSGDGRSYFSGVFVVAEEQHHEDEDSLGWCVWS